MATRLSETPFVHETARVKDCTLGCYTEVQEHCRLSESTVGDYSYLMEHCAAYNTQIGKFSNIASFVRMNATNHPMDRATLHHFTYRADDYWDDAEPDHAFFEARKARKVIIGHDTWLGHGCTILPGVTVGNGSVVAAGAVVTKSVAPYTLVGGIAAEEIRPRFPAQIVNRLEALAWWNWDHQALRAALQDFRDLKVEAFLEKYGG
ncbi:MAG: DapH/DapD/GlmU-related protein [Pseudomonadota bacterium]